MERKESKEPESSSVSSSSHTPQLSLELRHSISSHMETPFSPRTPVTDKFFPQGGNFCLGSLEYTQHFLRQYLDPPPGFGNKEKPDTAHDSQIYSPEDSSAQDNRTNLDSIDDLASEADFYTRESLQGTSELTDPKDLLREYKKYRGFCRRLHTKLLDIQRVTGLYYDQNTQAILDQINADVDCVPCEECERLRKQNEQLLDQLNTVGDSERTQGFDSKSGDPLYCSRKDFNEVSAELERIKDENRSLQEQLESEVGRNQMLEKKSEEHESCHTIMQMEVDSARQQVAELQDYIRKADLDNSSAIAELTAKHKAKIFTLKSEKAKLEEAHENALNEIEQKTRNLSFRLKEIQPDFEGLTESSVCIKCIQLGAANVLLEDRVHGLEEYVKASNERILKESRSAEKHFQDLARKYETTIADLELKLKAGNVHESTAFSVTAFINREVTESFQLISKWWTRCNPQNSDWLREGTNLIQNIGVNISKAETAQSMNFTCSGREQRQLVHQQIIKIEEMLNALECPSSAVVQIREAYLQLPYLLKPLFDMLKLHERKTKSSILDSAYAEAMATLKQEKEAVQSALMSKEAELQELRLLKSKNSELDAEVKQLQKTVLFHEKKTSSLRRDNDSLKAKVTELRTVLGEMKGKVETSASSEELAKCKEKLQGCKTKMEEHKEREGQLQKELQQLREFADYQSHQVMMLNEKAEELRLENDELKNSYEYKYT